MADVTYTPKVYRKQGGDEQVVASGGTITIESGGVIAVAAVGGLKIGGENVGVATIADVTASAAELNLLDGAGAMVASGTQHAHVVDAKVNYTTLDLDTEAEIITALNATNTKINSILAALEAFGINASA